MKKKIAALIAVMTVVGCCFVGCQPKNEQKKIESIKVTNQDNEKYEAALIECFDAMQSVGGGEVFYSYMYPDETIEAMKESGEYSKLVKTFNETQDRMIGSKSEKYTFGTVTEENPLSEKQVEGIKTYLVQLSEPYLSTLTEDKLDVGEGYEVTYDYSKNGQNKESETIIIFKLNDEGWKVITK